MMMINVAKVSIYLDTINIINFTVRVGTKMISYHFEDQTSEDDC